MQSGTSAGRTDTASTAKQITWSVEQRLVDEVLGMVVDGGWATDPQKFEETLPNLVGKMARCGKAIVQPLVNRLDHDDARRHIYAAWFLVQFDLALPGEIDNREAMEKARTVLNATLAEGIAEDRLWCCLLLAMGESPPEIKATLRQLLLEDDDQLKVLAASALTTIDAEDSELIRILRRGMGDDRPAVAMTAASALARLTLGTARPVDALLELLGNATESHHFLLINTLGRLGGDAAPALERLFAYANDRDNAPLLRGRAMKAIGEIATGTDQANEVLWRGLQSRERLVVEGAINGLVACGGFSPQTIDRVAALLGSDDPKLRAAAAWGLSEMKDCAAPAVPKLIARFDDERDSQALKAMVGALGAVGAAAVRPLVEVLRKGGSIGEAIVSSALSSMGTGGAKALGDAIRDESNPEIALTLIGIVRHMGATAAPTLPTLIAMLSHTDDEEVAAHLIIAMYSTCAVEADAADSLLRWVRKGNDELWLVAARALWSIGPDARPAIEAALDKAQDRERERLLHVLLGVQSRHEQRFKRLAALKNDEKLQVFVHIAEILDERGATSFPDLERLLEERKRQGTVGRNCRISASSLRLNIESLEERLGIKLTNRTSTRKGHLTDAARHILKDAKEYLAVKKVRPRAGETR